VHDGGEDLQEPGPAAEPARRQLATAALIAGTIAGTFIVSAAPAVADEKPSEVELSGYLQADVVPWDEGSVDELDVDGQPLNDERVLVRRARLRAEIERDRVFGMLELDGNTVAGPTARLVAAYVGARWRDEAHGVDADVVVGLFKIPFGHEVPSPEADRDVLEPTYAARALFPGNYDGGVRARATWRALELSVAFTNGAPSGDAQFKGRDPSQTWDLVGRAGAKGELTYGVTLGGGVSVLTGQGLHPGTPAIKDELRWLDQNEDGIVQDTEIVVAPGAPATPSERFDHSAVGADVEFGWCLCAVGKGRLTLEGVLATNLDRGIEYADPVDSDRDFRELGWYAQVVQEVKEHAQVAARWEQYRPDRDAFEVRGENVVPTDPRYRVISVAVEGHVDRARLIVQYDHEDNPRGRDVTGAPTTIAADRVTARAQVRF
jgi:hypothetical protein